MGNVIASMTMSLDGFVADRHGDVSQLYPDLGALRNTEMLDESIRATGAVVTLAPALACSCKCRWGPARVRHGRTRCLRRAV